PVHLTPAGEADPVLDQLPEPFYAVDSRDYQLTDIDEARLAELGASVLCLEKERPHVPLARAVMAIRFSPEVLGTQFHPEADGEGMLRYMLTEERKQQVITAYGEDKYHDMAIPPHQRVPREDEHAEFLTFDFAVCRGSDGELEPQLIEMQGFPSLYAFQSWLPDIFRQHYPIPESVTP
nr:hypothetical protein [Tanacetum cinerariifolium]